MILYQGFPHWGDSPSPHPIIFFSKIPPIKTDGPPLKSEAPSPTEKQPSSLLLKSEAPFQKMILRTKIPRNQKLPLILVFEL